VSVGRSPTTRAGGTPPAPLPDAFARPVDEVLAALRTSAHGLDDAEATRRLETYGPNALRAARPTSAWKILVDQVKSVVVALLFVAAGIALFLGDPLDAAAIAAVLVVNTLIGFVTEIRARRAMEALLRLETPRASVVRNGRVREIDAAGLVPGDVIALEAGQAIPADARVLIATELRTGEAALTGESLPVDKHAEPVAEDTPLPERKSMVYKGTTVVAGTGRAVVVGTGMATELGRIGGLVGEIEEERTPLERRLDQLGRRLVWLALGVAGIVVIVNVIQGAPIGRMVETGLALAIAAVPEGLPAVSTIALAVGVRRMARRRALVRRLPAVEALGSATVICTDKTGTLTAGEMTVTTLWTVGREIAITGAGYLPEGEFREDGRHIAPDDDEGILRILRAGTLASRADILLTDSGWVPRGDPTDAAIIIAARKAGLSRDVLLERWPVVGEVPFSSERMFLASFHQTESGETMAFVKGAPRRILELCARWATPDGEAPLDEANAARILEKNAELASRGLRVLAVADGPVTATREDAVRDLTFLGFVGMIDPPAPGVRQTVQRFREAGIRTVMLTGDQKLTAEAIASDLGVLGPGEKTLDGRDLARLDPGALAASVGNVGVFSRVSPEDKLKIVSAYQGHGEIVAMLGDGVNDAAALKKADIGVAMGIRGTDVAKEAAAVVLQDDRFQTIGAAIEEGRVIFDNIRKFVFYLFSCNVAEVLVLLIAGIAGLPAPLLPIQILWLNLVTDTFPALSLAFEPAEPNIMRQPPRDPKAAILSGHFIRVILFYGALITAATLGAFVWGLGGQDKAISLSFMTLALAQIFHLGNARSPAPVFRPDRILANRYAVGAVVLTVGLQLLAVYWMPLRTVLGLRPLAPGDWLVIAAAALMPAIVGQALKSLRFRPLAGP